MDEEQDFSLKHNQAFHLQMMRLNAASARDFAKTDFTKPVPDKYKVSWFLSGMLLHFVIY